LRSKSFLFDVGLGAAATKTNAAQGCARYFLFKFAGVAQLSVAHRSTREMLQSNMEQVR